MVPKLVQKLSILVSIYGVLFYDVLERLLGLLGALLGLMMASWGASGPQKSSKTKGFNAACLLFEALDGALGLVLPAFQADLAPKMGSKMVPKMVPKLFQKGVQKRIPKMTKNVRNMAP